MTLNRSQLNAIVDGLWHLITVQREKLEPEDSPVIQELMAAHNDIERLLVETEVDTFDLLY